MVYMSLARRALSNVSRVLLVRLIRVIDHYFYQNFFGEQALACFIRYPIITNH
jgi:hypothetical protein